MAVVFNPLSPIGLLDIFLLGIVVVLAVCWMYIESKKLIIKKMRVDAKFFRKHLGTNNFRTSQTRTTWKLSKELADIQSRVSVFTYLSIKKNIVNKTLKVSKRIDLRDRLYSRMTQVQREEADRTILEAQLAIAREVVELAVFHTRVTDSQMKFITGADAAYVWFSQETKEECEKSLSILNPSPKNALAINNGPDSTGAWSDDEGWDGWD